MWCAITENDYTVAIHKVGLYIIFVGEHRLSLVGQTEPVIMKIFEKVVFSLTALVAGGFELTVLFIISNRLTAFMTFRNYLSK